MKQFDVNTVALSGINLIEASAGTGKTFTLAELYCRLVVEQKMEVSHILVVTYTRAATEELRGRLRQRLVDERLALTKADPVLHRGAITRLKLAIQSFDEAAIYTIHGFCQRTLQDFAFESGYQFDMEMVSDERELQQAVVDDFWRRQVSQASALLVDYLLKKKQTPETLLKSVASLTGKPYVQLLPLPEMDAEVIQRLFTEQFEQVKNDWLAERDVAVSALTNKALLNGNKYRENSVLSWVTEMDALLAGAPQAELFERFNKFTLGELEGALKKGQSLPELKLWNSTELLLDLAQQLQTGYELLLQRLRLQLVQYLRVELPKRKQQLRVQAFDDLLLNLQQALKTEAGELLTAKIRQQFQAALIDEFQDTDPVQYDCFANIFTDPAAPVFFVGDPKQAIYSFRGADIFTYLQAKAAAQHEFNLDTNWRSHPLLVQAVNQLFERVDKPFLYDDIPFIPVNAARPNEATLTVNETYQPPLQFLWLETESAPNAAEMANQAAQATADQIAIRLNQAQSGELSLIDKEKQSRPLTGGDIAVLVRSHKQAVLIQQALKQRGINSVQQSRDSVFASEQALMLERVLLAIAQPHLDHLIATALATPIFGKTAAEIYQIQQDETAWLAQTDSFMQLHEQWQHQGFIVMFRALLTELAVLPRWLQQLEGERQVTNLLHLAELIQAQARRHQQTMEGILTWLASQRQQQDGSQDVAQIRLESDEQLVKVITIHTSKGLEYPLVFCPFLWHAGKPPGKPAVLTFHDPDNHNVCAAFGEPALSEAQEWVTAEEQAEDLRLLYVALTRAREQCVIVWAAAKTAAQTALFRLLHPQQTKVDAVAMQQQLVELTNQFPTQMQLNTVASQLPVSRQLTVETQQLQARLYRVPKHEIWSVSSFSGLTAGLHDERPDHDAQIPVLDSNPTITEKKFNRFYFPKGANAGTCLHELFEHWDFQSQDENWTQTVNKTLTKYSIDTEWTPVVIDWLAAVVNTDLAEMGIKLNQLQPSQRLDEMEFYFPVHELTAQRLKQTLLSFSESIPALKPLANTLNFKKITGFMKGFIDLLFEHEGRFYLADYKSNWLGNSVADYHETAIEEAMVSHAYTLQYLIYSVALHRFLAYRLADYDPERHFGGVFYLFIRGMNPEQQTGVFYTKPVGALIEAIDHCLTGWSGVVDD